MSYAIAILQVHSQPEVQYIHTCAATFLAVAALHLQAVEVLMRARELGDHAHMRSLPVNVKFLVEGQVWTLREWRLHSFGLQHSDCYVKCTCEVLHPNERQVVDR